MRSLLLCAVLFSAPSFAQIHDPILAIPITDDFLNDTNIRGFLGDLTRQAGYGHWQTERAAFLILDPNYTYRCAAWPYDGHLDQQNFSGTIPERTVAIAHTHPQETPAASWLDRQTAKALSVPIFVLKPRNIELVKPDGTSVKVVEDRWWIPATGSSSTRCSAPNARASR